jgi:hypothetical protein
MIQKTTSKPITKYNITVASGNTQFRDGVDQ